MDFNKHRYDINRKEYYCVKLSHIDYMMYKIEMGSLLDTQNNYLHNYSFDLLREMLCKSLILFSDIDTKNCRERFYVKKRNKQRLKKYNKNG